MTQRKRFKYLILTIALQFGVIQGASSDTVSKVLIPTVDKASQVNAHTVGVVFTHEELFHQLVHNLEDELEPRSGLRIVPVMGKNHVQSIYDLLYLNGIDLALVRADAVEYVKRKGNFPGVIGLVRKIAKVSEEKIVIVARKDIKTITDLRDKDVVIGVAGSGEYVTGTIAFDSIDIHLNALQINTNAAIENIKSGELAAFVYLLKTQDAAKSSASQKTDELFSKLTKENDIHVLSIENDDRLNAIYTPVKLTHQDLPNLVDKNEEINTYSVDAILASYNWPANHDRLKRVSRFVDAFVQGLDGLKTTHYQPAWKRVALESETPNIQTSGLIRYVIAEQQRKEEEERIAEQERMQAEKAARIERLTQQREEILNLLSKKIDSADVEETERLFNDLNQFLSVLESTPTDTESTQTLGASVLFELDLLDPTIADTDNKRVGSITIQENAVAGTDTEETFLTLSVDLEGVEPGEYSIATHERADCKDPGTRINRLADLVFDNDGKTKSNLRVDNMKIDAFQSRSIIVTRQAAPIKSMQDAAMIEDVRIVCGTST